MPLYRLIELYLFLLYPFFVVGPLNCVLGFGYIVRLIFGNNMVQRVVVG